MGRRIAAAGTGPGVTSVAEDLESRRLFSISFHTSGTVFYVDGDNSNQSITVVPHGQGIGFTDGLTEIAPNTALFNTYVVSSLGGDDTVSVDSAVPASYLFVFDGGDGNDTLVGGPGPETIYGGNGNDTLQGQGGNDTLQGGPGADDFSGGTGHDAVDYTERTDGYGVVVSMDGVANDGTDTDPYSSGSSEGDNVRTDVDEIRGTSYSDRLYATSMTIPVWLIGNNGNDIMVGGSGDDLLRGGDGADYMRGGGGRDAVDYTDRASGVGVVVWFDNTDNDGAATNGTGASPERDDVGTDIEEFQGTQYADRVNAQNQTVAMRLYGFGGDDVLVGGSGNDLLVGAAGNDWLDGQGGHDTIYGDDGNDSIFGLAGNDSLQGGAGADDINGGDGHDAADYTERTGGVGVVVWLDGLANDGQDTYGSGDSPEADNVRDDVEEVRGSAFNDRINGELRSAPLTLVGNAGDDVIVGGAGADWIEGDSGNDWLDGRGANDIVYGNDGNDVCYGYTGNDEVHGGAGDDRCYGGAGDDFLYAETGSDRLYGEQGNDYLNTRDYTSGPAESDFADGGDENAGYGGYGDILFGDYSDTWWEIEELHLV